MTSEACWVPVLTARGMGSTSSSITTGSGRGNTWTSEDRLPQCSTAWKGEYAWSMSLLKTYKGHRFLNTYTTRGNVVYSTIYPQSYPNMACTLFMQSGPSVVKICPSPPLRRSNSSKLSMASDICNWNITRAGGCICCYFPNYYLLKIFMDATESFCPHKDITYMCSFSPGVNWNRWQYILIFMNIDH